MAKLSDLVTLLARHRVDSRTTLNLFSRFLREAGRLSQAKKGFGAAEINALDAARMLIAVGATDRPTRAVAAEAVFSAAVFDPLHSPQAPDGFLAGIDTRLPLDQAVAGLLEQMPGALGQSVFLSIDRSDASASIRCSLQRVVFSQPDAIAHWKEEYARMKKGLGFSGLIENPPYWERIQEFHTGKNISATLDTALLFETAALLKE